jgi:hypothetical protein
METLIHWWHSLPAWSWLPIKITLTILIVSGIIATFVSDTAREIGEGILAMFIMLITFAFIGVMVWEGLSLIF